MTPTLRAHVITGGHPYDQSAFDAMIAALPQVRSTVECYPAAAEAFAPERVQALDALVFYDFRQALPLHQQAWLLAALRRGLGAVFLHHSIHSQLQWPEYRQVIGGCWDDQVFEAGGRRIGPSRASPGEQLHVQVVDRTHPVTAGLEDWRWTEECYADFWMHRDAHMLLATEHPRADRALAWCHVYGTARIVYLQPGHDAVAFSHPSYRQLLRQALRWVARRS